MSMSRENPRLAQNEIDSDDDEGQRTLFCANLDERVTEDLLYEVFLQAGPIESARIPKDHNGRQRTFGFITYVHKSTLPYAVQLYQGLSLYRKTLAIKGNAQPSPMGNMGNYSNLPACSSKRFGYDNSSLRVGHYSPFRDSPPLNPFKGDYSDCSPNSVKQRDNISKHASAQRRPHTNASPYQRNSGGAEEHNRDHQRDHNKRRHYNNGSNRHSDQRSGGKNRR